MFCTSGGTHILYGYIYVASTVHALEALYKSACVYMYMLCTDRGTTYRVWVERAGMAIATVITATAAVHPNFPSKYSIWVSYEYI